MTDFPQLQAGDVFGTRNPMALGRAINVIQRLWSHDNEAKYSHSGIILNSKGDTFESLWTIKKQNIWNEYVGKEIIIARPLGVDPRVIDKVLKGLIAKHEGQWYPVWRLPLHILPPLAKIMWLNRPVCSELTAKYEWGIGIRHGQWAGTNPDTLADEWRRWKNIKIVWEGELCDTTG